MAEEQRIFAFVLPLSLPWSGSNLGFALQASIFTRPYFSECYLMSLV